MLPGPGAMLTCKVVAPTGGGGISFADLFGGILGTLTSDCAQGLVKAGVSIGALASGAGTVARVIQVTGGVARTAGGLATQAAVAGTATTLETNVILNNLVPGASQIATGCVP